MQDALYEWIENQKSLLSCEQDEEITQMQQELKVLDDRKNPNVLQNLRLIQSSIGLFGRTVWALALPHWHGTPKAHTFTIGDVVRIRNTLATSEDIQESDEWTGVVMKLSEHRVHIVLEASDCDAISASGILDHGPITVDRLVNTTTYTKFSATLDRIRDGSHPLRYILFESRLPQWNSPQVMKPFHSKLNASQKDAIQFALASNDVAVIHGPPGTGKTTTLVELILQATIHHKLKILVCAPSNIAVDTVLDKLSQCTEVDQYKLRLLRIGHPARVTRNVLQHCLDAQVAKAENTVIVNDIRQEIQQTEREIVAIRNKNRKQKSTQPGQPRELYKLIRSNRKDIYKREKAVVGELLEKSQVIFATNVGASTKLLKNMDFDLAIIDEAAQALEISCWIPIMRSKRVVLAGDHCQLPPTIKSKQAATDGLQVTLFDRFMERAKMKGFEPIIKVLDTQYRMHNDICRWSSDAMYQSALKSFEGVAARRLQDLKTFVRHKKQISITLPEGIFQIDQNVLGATLYLLDTAGCDLDEGKERLDVRKLKKGTNSRDVTTKLSCSKFNGGEALLVDIHVRSLIEAGVSPRDIAVVTPYNKQVQVLKSRLSKVFKDLEIRSVDGFQGCEKEAVVMSLVRSNKKRQLGFLADERRMNVAVTRARRHVALICDSDTISANSFLKNLVKHFEAFGEVRSASEILVEYTFTGESLVEDGQENRTQETQRHGTRKGTVKPDSEKHKRDTFTKADLIEKCKTDEIESEANLTEKCEADQVESKANLVDKYETDQVGSEVEDEDEMSQIRAGFEVLAASSSSEEGDAVIEGDGTTEATSKQEYTCIPGSARKQNARPKKKETTISEVTKEIGGIHLEESDSTFLDRKVAESQFCGFRNSIGKQCKERTHLVYGSNCICCKARFCLKHVQAEVHGCTQAIRKHAAQQNKSQRSLTSQQKQSLQQKLQDQMEAKTKGRAKKVYKKKKK
ncbi:hypothetical protein ABG067_003590 [Albugo candida]